MKLKIHDTSNSQLAKQYPINNFKKASRKSIVLFLSILFVAFASSQTLIKDKQKTFVQKDTVKKNRIALEEEEEIVPDSLLLATGDFKFYKKSAHASYYADKFHGKRTASGKKYDKNKYTAAHKKLPFGSKVKITNQVNGKSVIVEVIDRGPFVRAREIDLSRRAFMEIASNKASGAMIVTIEVLQK